MPTDAEFFQHANMRAERARLLRTVSDAAQKILDTRRSGERGAIGEVALKGKVKPVSLDNPPTVEDFLNRIRKLGTVTRNGRGDPRFSRKGPGSIQVSKVTADTDYTGRSGFLAVDKDGATYFVDNQIHSDFGSDHMMHSEVAEAAYPHLADLRSDRALRSVLSNKNIARKAREGLYEINHTDNPKIINAVETDLLRDRLYGKKVEIDTVTPDGVSKSLTVAPGWDDLGKAIREAKVRQGWTTQTGAIKGTTLATSSTIGGVVGGIVGAHFGDPFAGTAIGWGVGFMTPAIAEHPAFWKTLNSIKAPLANLGISAKDWLVGTRQNPPVNADMERILRAQQQDVKGPTKSFLTRIAQLPGDIQNKVFDKFVFINDRPGALTNFLMRGDERGRAFRDLRGKLDVDNSPYVSAWLAAGGGGGMGEAHLLDYKKTYSEAQSKGLVNNLNEYLNLKGYQRVYDVMQERIQEADQNIQKYQQALAQPNLHFEAKAGLTKALRDVQAERQDVIDKLTSRTLVPDPYDPPKIANDLQALQAKLGPKFKDVEALANRVFSLNRKVLDMVHDSGIIGDEAYNKYTSRGDSYIPMHRILEQIADNNGRLSGTGTGTLYLRQQNVIKALMGSDKVNRDPMIASADANLEAMREVMRNGVIKDYLTIAAADPQGVGSYFKKVSDTYKAKPDEGLVGVYINGQQHTFATPSWLANSLKTVSPAAMDVIGKGPMRFFADILRKGATTGNLAWSLPNAMRHLADMALMSDAGIKSIRTLPKDVAGLLRDWTKNAYGAITHDPSWQEYMRSGAAYSTLQRVISPEDHLSPDTLGFKEKVKGFHIIHLVQDFNNAVEDVTKLTTYKRLRQTGFSEKAAAWETRRYGGGPDFAKGGTATPAINLATMFFGPHLQYISRVFEHAREHPARVAVALGALTAMSMTLNEHNFQQKDEKGNSLWRKIPYTNRENNFVILTGGTYQSSSGATLPNAIMIPKPSFVKILYNPIENMLNKVAGQEERSGTQLGLQALGNLLPGQMDLQEGNIRKSAERGVVSSLNPLVRTPLEEAMNYKTTGVGSPIIPNAEQNIDPRYQYGPSTSEMAKRMGQGGLTSAMAGGAEGAAIGYLLGGPKGAALGGTLGGVTGAFGVSPRRADHVIDTTTSGVGKIATGLVDPFLGGVKQTRLEGPEKLANTPIAGPVMGRFMSSSINQQEQTMTDKFYRDVQDAKEPINTLQFLSKNHPEQIPQYLQTHKNELWRGQVASQMESAYGELADAQKRIEQKQDMSDADKTKALRNLYDARMKMLSTFTTFLKKAAPSGQTTALPGQGQGSPR